MTDDGSASRPRLLAQLALGGYLLVLAAVVLLPLPDLDSLVEGARPLREGINLGLPELDLRSSWESQRNVVMTVPLGLLLPLVFRWGAPRLIAACLGAALIAEGSQLAVSAAIGHAYRSFDVNDVALNTLGGVVGLGVSSVGLWLWRHRAGLENSRPGKLAMLSIVAALALVGAAVVGSLSPRPAVVSYDACERSSAIPPTPLREGATAQSPGDGALCIRHDGGASSVSVSDAPTAAMQTSGEGGVFIIGSTSDSARGVVAQLPDGSQVRATLHSVPGLDEHLVWVLTLSAEPGGEVRYLVDKGTGSEVP